MKGTIAAIFVGCAIAAGNYLYTSTLFRISDELLNMNNEVMENIEKENYDEAIRITEEMHSYIHQKRTVLAATGSHAVIDDIEMNLFELSGYTESGQKGDAVSRCRVLGFLYEHLPEDYKIRAENIL